MIRRLDPDLPPGVRRAAAELRTRRPSPEFETNLSAALAKAERRTSLRRAAKARVRTASTGRWLAVVSATGGALLAGELWLHDPAFVSELNRTEQLQLELNDEGHTWLPLSLATEHHDEQPASVHVDVPRNVSVEFSDHAKESLQAPECDLERCIHRFEHPTTTPHAPPLRIGVSEPGQYRIEVHHASAGQKVREVFVVEAR